MNRRAASALLLSALSLVACTSAPIHYHTLQAPDTPRTTADDTATAPASFAIDVLPVGIPAQIDQAQLVVRRDDDALAVLDTERWIDPPGEAMRALLSSELVQRLHARDLAGLPRGAATPVLRIKLQVRRFDAWPDRQVRLDADWRLHFAQEPAQQQLICHGHVEAPAAGGYAELVRAQQDALRALAARIATDAQHWSRTRDAECTRKADAP